MAGLDRVDAASGAERPIRLTLRVSDSDGAAEFKVNTDPRRTVLDLLEALRAASGQGAASGTAASLRGAEPSGTGPAHAVPAYRHSCHHGSCGTCGAVINGLEGLMCLTTIASIAAPRPRAPGGPALPPPEAGDGSIIVELRPLSGMATIAGIAVDPARALAGIPRDAAYLTDSDHGGRAELPPDPTLPAGFGGGRVRFESCIECGLCVSACPIRIPFVGPAALAAVNREKANRPGRSDEMLRIAAAPDGVGACGRHLACSRVCPQAVYPGKHIQRLRDALAEGAPD